MIFTITKPEFYQYILSLNVSDKKGNVDLMKEIILLLSKDKKIKTNKSLFSEIRKDININQSKIAFKHDLSMKIFSKLREF